MSNKEPWLAVNLSKIFPGIGQIYAGYQTKGYLFILVTISLSLLSIWLFISPTVNILFAVACLLLNVIFGFWNFMLGIVDFACWDFLVFIVDVCKYAFLMTVVQRTWENKHSKNIMHK